MNKTKVHLSIIQETLPIRSGLEFVSFRQYLQLCRS